MRALLPSVLRCSVFGGALFAFSCATAGVRTPPNLAVIVLTDAKDVHWSDIYDGQVGYKVSEPYPGQRSISEVHKRLQELGWVPRKVDFLNPAGSSATKAERGDTEAEGRVVSVWAEQWESSAGDIVEYGFRYWGDSKSDSHGPMDVVVSYFRAETVKAVQEDLRRQKQ
jgi:hypothetical protein